MMLTFSRAGLEVFDMDGHGEHPLLVVVVVGEHEA